MKKIAIITTLSFLVPLFCFADYPMAHSKVVEGSNTIQNPRSEKKISALHFLNTGSTTVTISDLQVVLTDGTILTSGIDLEFELQPTAEFDYVFEDHNSEKVGSLRFTIADGHTTLQIDGVQDEN